MVKLQNVILVTENMEKSFAFYNNALGLELKFRDGDKWIQFDADGCSFALAAPEEVSDHKQGSFPVFEVSDLDKVKENLELAGADVSKTRNMGTHGKTATIIDPDGNVFQLFMRTF